MPGYKKGQARSVIKTFEIYVRIIISTIYSCKVQKQYASTSMQTQYMYEKSVHAPLERDYRHDTDGNRHKVAKLLTNSAARGSRNGPQSSRSSGIARWSRRVLLFTDRTNERTNKLALELPAFAAAQRRLIAATGVRWIAAIAARSRYKGEIDMVCIRRGASVWHTGGMVPAVTGRSRRWLGSKRDAPPSTPSVAIITASTSERTIRFQPRAGARRR